MMVPNLGDLSQSFSIRNRNVALRQQVARYTQELATGQVANVREVLQGNLGYLSDIERKMSVLEGYRVATTEARHFTNGMQVSIGEFMDTAQALSGSLISAGTSALSSARAAIAAEAQNGFATVVGRINTNVSGRYLFAGTATDTPPLPDPDTVLAALRTAITGATNAADMELAAEAWFDDPAGFAASLYQGSANAVSPFLLGPSDTASLELTALDPEIKRLLKLTGLAALADDSVFALSDQEQKELLTSVGEEMLAARDGVTSIGARVGFVEARIEQAITRNAAEQTGLEFAKAELLEIDPFESATRLEDVQFNLESLYRVTVRNSQLSLVNFL